jgi:MFS family permease
VVVLVGQAMASMDASILAVASPSLRADLHSSDAQFQLIVAMYTMAFAAFVVTGARLGDVLGQRRAFLFGLAGFTVASLVGGLAPTSAVLVGARALQGTAAAVMTPQVLSIIQLQFDGEARARAVGAYSMVLAAGVAAGQVLGGLLVSAHLLAAAWRPALLLNAPVGAALLLASRRGLPKVRRGASRRPDPAGTAVLAIGLLALVIPLTFGRQAGWPPWVWLFVAAALGLVAGFVALERSIAARGGDPLFDLDVWTIPGVTAGVAAITLIMACYAGFLISLTLHLQDSLGFSPLQAGLTFAAYASGFAAVSLTWTRAGAGWRHRLPVAGPLAMGTSLVGIGFVAAGGGWPIALTTALLFCGGGGHACGFSPLASRLTTLVRPDQAADLSGLVLTASLLGQVLGVAVFTGVYFGGLSHGSAPALAHTTIALAGGLAATATCAATMNRVVARRAAAWPADANDTL